MTEDRKPSPFCALIVMGVSGSGKTTAAVELAKRIGWIFKDGDDFHSQHDIEKMHAGHPLDDRDRMPWLHTIAAEIARRRQAQKPIVIACSALKRAYRDILVAGHSDVRIIYLKGSHDLIAARLASRKGHFMPPRLLDSQFDALEEPREDEHPIVVGIDAPVDKIVDHIVEQLRKVGIGTSGIGP